MQDIGEKENVVAKYPKIVQELEQLGEEARSILGDKITNRIAVKRMKQFVDMLQLQ